MRIDPGRFLLTYLLLHGVHMPAQVITFYLLTRVDPHAEGNPLLAPVLAKHPYLVFLIPIPTLLFITSLAELCAKFRNLILGTAILCLFLDSLLDAAIIIYCFFNNRID